MVMVRSLEPQEIADVSVQMCSPSRAGMYQGQWRMCTATGLYYGGEYVLVRPRVKELMLYLNASPVLLIDPVNYITGDGLF